MTKCVFLDRDGVINMERGDYTWRQSDFKFTPELFPVLRCFQEAGFLLVIITNQGGIVKGRYTLEEFYQLSDWMLGEFLKNEVEISDLFFSPHHDEKGKSLSRKPESLLFERAIHRFDIDPSASFMIGDSERDIFAAEQVGVNGILIEANSPLAQIKDRILNV